MKILLVDDEKGFVLALKEILQQNFYTVDYAYDGMEALEYLEMNSYDCILLDVMMPRMDGYSLIQNLRNRKDNTPVIFLSAKGDVEDRIKGLSLGGDDYLPKPFSSKELLLRLKALLRRKDGIGKENLSFEGLVLDETDFTLRYQDKCTPLSSKEYQLMESLLRKPGHVHSGENLMKEAWSSVDESDISSLWVFISNLRKKLKALNCPVVIKSERGLGYRLEKKDV